MIRSCPAKHLVCMSLPAPLRSVLHSCTFQCPFGYDGTPKVPIWHSSYCVILYQLIASRPHAVIRIILYIDNTTTTRRLQPPSYPYSRRWTRNQTLHLRRPPRSTAEHRQHPYIIPGRNPSTQRLRRVPENSSFGTDTEVGGSLSADQRRLPGTLEPSLPTTLNVAPSTQLTTSTLIPDLTSLITRCSQDPISGGTYGNIYKCIYDGPEGNEEVAVKAIRPQFFSPETFRRELGIWKRLRHSNILKFMGTTSDFGPSVALVAPWMTNGTLTSFLDQNDETLVLRDRLLLVSTSNVFPICTAEFIVSHTSFVTLLLASTILDRRRTYGLEPRGSWRPHWYQRPHRLVIERHILQILVLSGTFKKLTGMTYLAKMTCHPGAVRWAAPELLSGEESDSAATTQSDMYSFGSIMLQVLTGNVPWCHLTRDFQITVQVVIERKIHPRPDDVCVTDPHWDFMTRCWSMSLTDSASCQGSSSIC
ncbi:kinase-like domain-containing protein [Suillus subluteus]|nr:kinase-like domain-containing protein [Suillus subluteus]